METNARTVGFDFWKDYRDSLRPTRRTEQYGKPKPGYALASHRTQPEQALSRQYNGYVAGSPAPMTVRDFSSLCSAWSGLAHPGLHPSLPLPVNPASPFRVSPPLASSFPDPFSPTSPDVSCHLMTRNASILKICILFKITFYF